MLRVVNIIKKKRSNKHGILQKCSILFYCYVIKSAGEVANKVLLSVVWNPLLIEINLSQIWILSTKREKVFAVCQYLLCLYILQYKNSPVTTNFIWFTQHFYCKSEMNKKTELTKIVFDMLRIIYFKYNQQCNFFKWICKSNFFVYNVFLWMKNIMFNTLISQVTYRKILMFKTKICDFWSIFNSPLLKY